MIVTNIQWTPLIFLFVFFVFRYAWSIIGGKRQRQKSTNTIVFFRKFFELLTYLILPVLLSINLIPQLLIIEENLYIKIIGILFSIVGLLFIIWTRISRKQDWGLMGDIPGNVLVKTGAYSVCRHPYYIGAILLILGIYLQLNSLYIVLAILGTVFLFYVMKKEDAELFTQFGKEYLEYKKKVGIIPWIR